jgi:inner membrane transporter RhtA
MGIAVTLGFVPPLVMALVSARRRLDLLWVAMGGAGVATLSGIARPRSLAGVVVAVAAGVAWVGVAYAGRSLGQRTRRADGLALALPIAALISLPFGVGHLGQISPGVIGLGLVIAVGGLIVPFTLELEGLRRLAPATVAVIYSVDPANAAIIGLLVLGQRLTGLQVAGMLAVIVAIAGMTLGADKTGAPTGGGLPAP